MLKPVLRVVAGHTYEREALAEHWRRRPLANPMGVGDHVPSAKMICNFGCRQAVDAWLLRFPNQVPAGWESRSLPSRHTQQQLDELAARVEEAARSASRAAKWARLAQAGLDGAARAVG